MKNVMLAVVSCLAVYTLALAWWVFFREFYAGKVQKVDLTQQMKKMIEEMQNDSVVEVKEEPPESTCIVHEPVYLDEEVAKVYKFKNYSYCRTPTNDLISFSENQIIAKCEIAEARYIIDPGDPQVFGGEFKNKDIRWSKRNFLNQNSEFAFVKCGPKSVYAFAFIKYNSTVAKRVKEIKEKLGKDSKPMNVLLLVFDSLSRFTVKRFLPKLRSFMDKGITGKDFHPNYSVYEFKRIGTPDTFTIPNMIQILYGDQWEQVKSKLVVKKPPIEGLSEAHLAFQQENSIWSYYSSLGFTTLFLMDTVWDFTVRFIGRKVLADHVFANYWRAAWAVFGYEDFSNRQRCVGNQDSHNLTFTYVDDYYEKYSGLNKFAYVHLDAAHERTGNIQTVDKDIVPFVQGLMEKFSKKGENFAMFLISDHGIRFPYLQFDFRNHLELTSPMGFFIVDKEIERKLDARENLYHNSQQLVGRMDMNFALKYLAHAGYGYKNDSYFDWLKRKLPVPSVFNLFKEKIPRERGCKDLAVPDWKCVCSYFSELGNQKVINQLVALVAQYSKVKAAKDTNCKKISEYKVVSAEKFVSTPMNKGLITLYKAEFLVNGQAVAIAKFVFCYPGKIKEGYKKLEGDDFPIREYKLREGKAIIQLRRIQISGCQINSCFC